MKIRTVGCSSTETDSRDLREGSPYTVTWLYNMENTDSGLQQHRNRQWKSERRKFILPLDCTYIIGKYENTDSGLQQLRNRQQRSQRRRFIHLCHLKQTIQTSERRIHLCHLAVYNEKYKNTDSVLQQLRNRQWKSERRKPLYCHLVV